MYDIRQFKPALYFLLLLGMTGFSLAAEWPGLWVLSAGGVLLNGWLVKTGRFTPMPRFLASIVTLIAFVYIADLVLHSATTPILIIGQFLVLLQLVKLFEQRANRDYAQLIILSLLLMVAAAINTASLMFGVMFIGYLFLSLYVCLLFHLKVESEEARKAIELPETDPNPVTLRQDQRYLSSSMRRLTGLISIVAIAMAINVFLFFPRGTGANLLGPLQFKPTRALTGFSENVTFQQVARITQNTAHVADVTVWHNGKLVDGTQPLYFRGLTLEFYNGANDMRWGRSQYQWMRLLPAGTDITVEHDDDEREIRTLPSGTDTWRQSIDLQPTGTPVLFSLAGPASIKSARRAMLRASRFDQAIHIQETPQQPLDYEVVSDGKILYEPYPAMVSRPWRMWQTGETESPRPASAIDPKIRDYARKPEVSGVGPGNVPLVELRDRALNAARVAGTYQAEGLFDPPTRYDAAIAGAIQNHLRTQFSYTLDLTDTKRIEGVDPMVAFLYDFKRGHCEYFAGAMSLMLQSLGIPARMVIGFRCDEYNNIGQYYSVNQSHAHAWVESRVGGDPGSGSAAYWQNFDPTSGTDFNRPRSNSLVTRLRHFFDYLEHTWASNVIAYDRGSRDNLVQNLETKLTSTAVNGGQRVSRVTAWINAENFQISSTLLTFLVGAAILALIVAVGWYAWERWRLWRRAERIGLDALPADERLRLARQLGFYDQLVQMLERHGHLRPAHLTPMEFSESLSFLPADAYDAVHRLTDVFYRIRYGRHELSPVQRDRLHHTIAQLESILGPARM